MHSIEMNADAGWDVIHVTESYQRLDNVENKTPEKRAVTTCADIDDASHLANRLNGGMSGEAAALVKLALEKSQ